MDETLEEPRDAAKAPLPQRRWVFVAAVLVAAALAGYIASELMS